MAVQDISDQMAKAARILNAQFSLNGRPLTLEEVFSNKGMLPGIARRADQLSSLCLGYGIGVSFEDAEGTALGVKAIFDEITPHSLRILCMIDVLGELIKGAGRDGVTPLDQLLYD